MGLPDGDVVYHPDMKEDGPSSGLCCFMDKERPCGADCMAFLTDPPSKDDYVGQQWSHCHLLVNAHRVGKHLVVLAQVGGELLHKQRVHAADQARSTQAPPTMPR